MLSGKIMTLYAENLARCVNTLFRQNAESFKGKMGYACG